MDWFINKDDELYVEDSSNSLSYDPTFDIENVFNKQNTIEDYEVRMDDFVLDKSDTNSNSKLPSPNDKIFEIYNKNLSKDMNTVSNTPSVSGRGKTLRKKVSQQGQIKEKTMLTKEELSRHPFLVSRCADNIKAKNRKSTDISDVRPGKLSISIINQNSTASIEENTQSLNKSFESASKQNFKLGSYSNQRTMSNFTKSAYDLTCGNNYFGNEEERASVMYDCQSLINNDSYSIFDSNKIPVDSKYLHSKTDFNMANNNQHDLMRNHKTCPYDHNNLINSNSTIPCNFSLQHLPISERMKIKREKTKMLLEKKTKRENFTCDINYEPNGEEAHDRKGVESIADDSIIMNNKNASKLNDELSNSVSCISPGNMNNNILSKRKFIMLRNRISAQRSRDRKKKEMDELKIISRNLFNENCYLKKEIEKKDRELTQFKDKLQNICKNCDNTLVIKSNEKENISSSLVNQPDQNTNNRLRYSLVDLSRRNLSNSYKYSLMTGFLVVVCLIGTLAWQSVSSMNDSNNFGNPSFGANTGRVLLSNEGEKIQTPESKNYPSNSLNGVILYENSLDRENLLNLNLDAESDINFKKFSTESSIKLSDNPLPAVKNQKRIFDFRKDFEKFKQKQNITPSYSSDLNSKENISIEGETKLVDDEEFDDYSNFDQNIQFNFEASLLEKKRFEFFIKMQNRKSKSQPNSSYISSGGFLRKEKVREENICVNTNDLTWSIQEELELNDENDKLFDSNFPKDNASNQRGIILKTNDQKNYNLNQKFMTQVVPIKDSRLNYGSSNLNQNIKSMYCRDFITTNEENSEMFKKLFEKLMMNEARENVTFNSSSKYYEYDKK